MVCRIHDGEVIGYCKAAIQVFFGILWVPIFLLIIPAEITRQFFSKTRRPSLLWGSVPLRSIQNASEALQDAGYFSRTIVLESYRTAPAYLFDYALDPANINNKAFRFLIRLNWSFLFLLYSIFKFSHFHFSFDGGILRQTPFRLLEIKLLSFLGKKLIFFPYGNDSFVYEKLQNKNWRQALQSSYPRDKKQDDFVAENISFFSKYADCVLGSVVHTVNLDRVDIWPVVWFPFNSHLLAECLPKSTGKITIAHCPNHRAVKGTAALISAVSKLSENYHIDFLLLEGLSNEEVIDKLKTTDILVDQLIFGYSLNAIEGMALGKVVISGLDNALPEYRKFYEFSYLSKCPIVEANTENIYQILEELIGSRDQWQSLGIRGKEYVEQYHSRDGFVAMMSTIYESIETGTIEKLGDYFVQ